MFSAIKSLFKKTIASPVIGLIPAVIEGLSFLEDQLWEKNKELQHTKTCAEKFLVYNARCHEAAAHELKVFEDQWEILLDSPSAVLLKEEIMGMMDEWRFLVWAVGHYQKMSMRHKASCVALARDLEAMCHRFGAVDESRVQLGELLATKSQKMAKKMAKKVAKLK